MELIKSFLPDPCYTSSVFLICNIPYTIYVRNYKILYTQVPLGITSILLHRHIYEKIRFIDIIVANMAFLQHFRQIYLYGNKVSKFFYMITPLTFIASKYYAFDPNMQYESSLLHAFMHYFLCIGTAALNYSVGLQKAKYK